MQKYKLTLKKEIRLDKYLLELYPLLNLSLINKFLRQGKIKVNNKKVKANHKLSTNDELAIFFDEKFLEKPTKDTAYLFSKDIDEIIYEDDNFLFVNKPSGISVFDEDYKNYDTLLNRVKKYFKDSDINPFLCHRLDTGTQGLIIIAKNEKALDFMLSQFKNKAIDKTYYCISYTDDIKTGLNTAYLLKDEKNAVVYIHNNRKTDKHKEIKTNIEIIDRKNNLLLLKVNIITGRTHQIRAHLKHLNAPILGDSKYGINSINRQLKLKYQLLVSAKIKFSTIKEEDFSYLSNKEFACSDAWFIKSYYNDEFILKGEKYE